VLYHAPILTKPVKLTNNTHGTTSLTDEAVTGAGDTGPEAVAVLDRRVDAVPGTMVGLPAMIEAPSDIVSKIPVLLEMPLVFVEAVSIDVERVDAPVGLSDDVNPRGTDVGVVGWDGERVDTAAEDVDSASGLIKLTEAVDEEDTRGVEVEVVGRSPPLLIGASPSEDVVLVVEVDSGRAVEMEVEVTSVVEVDPCATVVLVTEVTVEDAPGDVGPVGVTVVVVEDVSPPPAAEVRYLSEHSSTQIWKTYFLLSHNHQRIDLLILSSHSETEDLRWHSVMEDLFPDSSLVILS
jgi:hypothetical protein